MSHEEPIRAVQFHDCDDDLRKHSQVEKLVERINSKAGHIVITVADAEYAGQALQRTCSCLCRFTFTRRFDGEVISD